MEMKEVTELCKDPFKFVKNHSSPGESRGLKATKQDIQISPKKYTDWESWGVR